MLLTMSVTNTHTYGQQQLVQLVPWLCDNAPLQEDSQQRAHMHIVFIHMDLTSLSGWHPLMCIFHGVSAFQAAIS